MGKPCTDSRGASALVSRLKATTLRSPTSQRRGPDRKSACQEHTLGAQLDSDWTLPWPRWLESRLDSNVGSDYNSLVTTHCGGGGNKAGLSQISPIPWNTATVSEVSSSNEVNACRRFAAVSWFTAFLASGLLIPIVMMVPCLSVTTFFFPVWGGKKNNQRKSIFTFLLVSH